MFDRAHWERIGQALHATQGPLSEPAPGYVSVLLHRASMDCWEAVQDWSAPEPPQVPDEAYWLEHLQGMSKTPMWTSIIARVRNNYRRPMDEWAWDGVLSSVSSEWAERSPVQTLGTPEERVRLHALARALKVDFGLARVDVEIHHPLHEMIEAIEGMRPEMERLAHHLGVQPQAFGRGTLVVHLHRQDEHNPRFGAMGAAQDESVLLGHGRLYYTVDPNLQDGLTLGHEWAHLWDAMLKRQGIDAPQALMEHLETPWLSPSEEAQARGALMDQWGRYLTTPGGASRAWGNAFLRHLGWGAWEELLAKALKPHQDAFDHTSWRADTEGGFQKARAWVDGTHEAAREVLRRHCWKTNVSGDKSLKDLQAVHRDLHATLDQIQAGAPHPRAAIGIVCEWMDRSRKSRPQAYWNDPAEIWARTMEHVVYTLDRHAGFKDRQEEAQGQIHRVGYFAGLGVVERALPWLMERGPAWGVTFPGIAQAIAPQEPLPSTQPDAVPKRRTARP